MSETRTAYKAPPAPRQTLVGAFIAGFREERRKRGRMHTYWLWIGLFVLTVGLRIAEGIPWAAAVIGWLSYPAFGCACFWLGWQWRTNKCTLCWRPAPTLRLSAHDSCHACQAHRDAVRDWWEDQHIAVIDLEAVRQRMRGEQ